MFDSDRFICKYEINPVGFKHIELPHGSQMLCVASQRESLVLWAVVNPKDEMETRSITMLCTGEPFRKPLGKHLGTVQSRDQLIVLHFFADR